MAKVRRVHCKIRHVDAYIIERDDNIVVRCPQRPYCKVCPFEKMIEQRK